MDKYALVKQIGRGSFGCASVFRRKSDKVYVVAKQITVSEMSSKEQQDAVKECTVLKERPS